MDNENLLDENRIKKNDIILYISELSKNFEIEISEWTAIVDNEKNKFIFLMEFQNFADIEVIEKYLCEKMSDKFNILCSIYKLEDGSFNEYINYKRNLGVPINLIKIPKFVKNPYDKDYFFNKIDERY